MARNNIVLGERVSSNDKNERQARNEVCVGDAIQAFYRSRCFDFALSIATIHHFSTPSRRVQAVKELIRIVRPVSSQEYAGIKERQTKVEMTKEACQGYEHITQQSTGRFLIYVWALEQRGESRRKFEQISKAEDEKGRDLLVPWVLKCSDLPKEEETSSKEEKVFQRCESCHAS